MIRALRFCFKPELIHKMMLTRLAAIQSRRFLRSMTRITHPGRSKLGTNVLGLKFSNPVGVAAGFDVNGKYILALSDIGFGHVEVGPLSYKAQNLPVSRKDRLRWNKKEQSLTHNAVSNNEGISAAIKNIKEARKQKPRCLVGINLAAYQNQIKDELIIKDFEDSFTLAYDFADYFVINISNPNVDGIRNLQNAQTLSEIMDPLLSIRLCEDVYKPILIKIGLDIPFEVLDEMIDYCRLSGVDGIVVGNSPRILDNDTKKTRFVSGNAAYGKTLDVTRHIHEYTDGRFAIIATGGIMTPAQAKEIIGAGASLIQLHTGLTYSGFRLVKKIQKALQGD